jgi:sulfite exporter TauE/SafE
VIGHGSHADAQAAATLASALLLGLSGAFHCAVMCGGLAAAVAHAPDAARASTLPRTLLCASGRIAAYALLGAITAALGRGIATGAGDATGIGLRIAFGAVLLLLGLQLVRPQRGFQRLESLGAKLWRYVAPLARRLRPLDRAWKLLAFGALWGFLPCGLVYGALAGAAVAGTPAGGALWMGAFGLGTIPALAGIGAATSRITALGRGAAVRASAGVMIAGYGLWTILGAVAMRH